MGKKKPWVPPELTVISDLRVKLDAIFVFIQ